jgi:hypothetical protein
MIYSKTCLVQPTSQDTDERLTMTQKKYVITNRHYPVHKACDRQKSTEYNARRPSSQVSEKLCSVRR